MKKNIKTQKFEPQKRHFMHPVKQRRGQRMRQQQRTKLQAKLQVPVLLTFGIVLLTIAVSFALQDQTNPSMSETKPSPPRPSSVQPTPDATPTKPTTMPALSPAAAPTTGSLPSPTTTPEPTLQPSEPDTDPAQIVYYNGYADPRTIDPKPALYLGESIALVNKYYTLDKNYEPVAQTVPGTPYMLCQPALDAWLSMQSDCTAATGTRVYLTSGYRSYAVQEYTFHDAVRRKGIAWTVPYNAYPGRSEHQLALAIDVNDGVYNKYSIKFSQTATYAWLNEHAHEYGYILRYPKEKEAVTGYAYEPWHYRFVGVEHAARIKAEAQTLEEYLGVG